MNFLIQKWLGRQDSNLRMRGSKPRALTNLATSQQKTSFSRLPDQRSDASRNYNGIFTDPGPPSAKFS